MAVMAFKRTPVGMEAVPHQEVVTQHRNTEVVLPVGATEEALMLPRRLKVGRMEEGRRILLMERKFQVNTG